MTRARSPAADVDVRCAGHDARLAGFRNASTVAKTGSRQPSETSMRHREKVVACAVLLAGMLQAQGAPSGYPMMVDEGPGGPARAVIGGTDTELGGTNEPTIVIDPNDSSRVAMASLFIA